MATPPTRVSYQEPTAGYGSTTATKVTPAFDVVAGDLITLIASEENGTLTIGTPTSTGSITWTAQGSTNTGVNNSALYMWTGVVNTTATGITITVANSGGSNAWNFSATVWRNHGGVGNTAINTGAATTAQIAITCSANSALVGQANDWNAVDGASRTWLSINSTTIAESVYYSNPGLTHTVYGGRSPDVGAAGSKTWGLSAPTGQKAAVGAIEILGTGGAAADSFAHWTQTPPGWESPAAHPIPAIGDTTLASGTPFTVTGDDPEALTDAAAFDVATVDVDTVGLIDTTASDVAKVAGDDTGLTDTASIALSRPINDAEGLTDATTADVGKNPTDPEALTDSSVLDVAKTVTETTGLTDSTSADVGKVATDDTGLTDSTIVEKGRLLTQDDPEALTDSTAADVGKATTDSAGNADTAALDVATIDVDPTGLTDTTSAAVGKNQTDIAGLTDAVVLQLFKAITETAALSDLAALTVGKVATDTTGLADTASVDLTTGGGGGGTAPTILKPRAQLIGAPDATLIPNRATAEIPTAPNATLQANKAAALLVTDPDAKIIGGQQR